MKRPDNSTYYACPPKATSQNGQMVNGFTCTFTANASDATILVSVESQKDGSPSTETTPATVTPINAKTLTLTGSLAGVITKPDSTEACSSWAVQANGASQLAECLVQVLAITSTGLMVSSTTNTTEADGNAGRFTIVLKAPNVQRENLTLHLARADGSYRGPILLKTTTKNSKVTGFSTLVGSSYKNGKKAQGPIDRTLNLGVVNLLTKSGQTAFGKLAIAPASTDVTSKSVLMIGQIPTGAGSAGFVKTSTTTTTAWNKVLNYGINSGKPVTSSVVNQTSQRPLATISFNENSQMTVTVNANAAPTTPAPSDCKTYFDNGSALTLDKCYTDIIKFLKGANINKDVTQNFQSNCSSLNAAGANATLAVILSREVNDACRVATLAVIEATHSIGQSQDNGGGQDQQKQQQCSNFANSGLKMSECYYLILAQLSQQNPTLVNSFVTACSAYGANDPATNAPIDPTNFAKASTFGWLTKARATCVACS